MEVLLEFLFQIFGEVLLQLFIEALVELGMHSLAETVQRPRHPVYAAIGFVLLGLIAGAVSLLVLPHSPIAAPQLRLANLIVTPVVIGLVMMLVGRLRAKRGQDLVRLDRFGYAFLFAFAMGLVRFVWVS